MEYQNYLMHFNPNHDPRNGQFTKGHGGNSITRAEVNTGRKIFKAGKKVKQNITSDRGKKVLKTVAVAAACDVGMTFLMKRMGVQMLTAMKQGVFKFEKGSPARELVKMAYRTPTDVKSVTMSAGKSAIKAGLTTAGLMKIKDVIKARKEKRGENSK